MKLYVMQCHALKLNLFMIQYQSKNSKILAYFYVNFLGFCKFLYIQLMDFRGIA